MSDIVCTPADVYRSVQLLVRPRIVFDDMLQPQDYLFGEPPYVRFMCGSDEKTGRMILYFDVEAAVMLIALASRRPETRRAVARGLNQVKRRADALVGAIHLPSAVRYTSLMLPYPLHLRDERARALITAMLYQTCLDVGHWPRPTLRELYRLSDSTLDRLIADARRFGYLLPYNPQRDRPLSGRSSLVGGPRTRVFVPGPQRP